jgi:hypothetical protein
MNRSGTIRAARPNDPSARDYQQQHNAVTDFVLMPPRTARNFSFDRPCSFTSLVTAILLLRSAGGY